MKKFLISLLVIVLILGGAAGYALFTNNAALLTVFTSDQDKIKSVTETAITKLNENDYFNVTLNVDLQNEESGDGLLLNTELKIMKAAEDTYQFTATTQKTEIDSNVSQVSSIEYYYDGTILYEHILASDTVTEEKNQNTVSLESALSRLSYFGAELLFPNFDEAFFENLSQINSTIYYSLMPLSFGEKFSFTLEDDAATLTLGISLFGNIKELGYAADFTFGSSTTTFDYLAKYNNHNAFTLTVPTDLEEYQI